LAIHYTHERATFVNQFTNDLQLEQSAKARSIDPKLSRFNAANTVGDTHSQNPHPVSDSMKSGKHPLIAAHARAIGATIVTTNADEFKRTRGLNVENWLA
jgi:hypothetical protein